MQQYSPKRYFFISSRDKYFHNNEHITTQAKDERYQFENDNNEISCAVIDVWCCPCGEGSKTCLSGDKCRQIFETGNLEIRNRRLICFVTIRCIVVTRKLW